MSKPLFFTGRKEISRSDVTIRLFEQRGKPSHFEARIDFSRYRLPPEADVVVEAYHNTYYERFSIGALGELDGGCSRELKGLEPGDRPHFRVKVIGSNGAPAGQLLAAIDEVRPATEDDDGAAGSLLPLIPKPKSEMGDVFWRVHFVSSDELRPELWINRDVEGLFLALQNQNPQVTGLIMPEVLRQVLRGLVEDGAPWTDEGLLGQWLQLAKDFYPDEFDDWDEEDESGSRQRRREWVDNVVANFASAHQFFQRYHEQCVRLAGEDDDD